MGDSKKYRLKEWMNKLIEEKYSRPLKPTDAITVLGISKVWLSETVLEEQMCDGYLFIHFSLDICYWLLTETNLESYSAADTTY